MQNFEFPEYPAYPAYKPSGIAWLGDIPAHWDVLPHRALFTQVIDRGHPSEQMLSVTIADGIITQKDLLRDASKKDQSRLDKSNYKLVRPGDIAYNKMRAWQGAIGVSDYTGIVSPAYVVHRAKPGANPRYFHYLLRTPAFAAEAARHSYGIASDMWSLRPEHFKVIYSCVPPLPEQRAIAAYLDRKGDIARRYAIVARRIIANLRELRQVEIHDAVTRGLNEHAPLKPSGIAWLGGIPAHWDTRRLKYSAKTIMGQSPSGYDCAETPIGPPFLQGSAEFQERHPSPALYCRAPKKISPAGAILLSVRAPVGRLNIADQEYAIGRGLCAIIPDNKNLDTTFAYYHLQAITTGLRMASTGSIFDAVRLSDVRNQPIITPPLPEQRAIAAYLDAQTAKIDAAIAHYERMAELVAEYWTVLAADAVTGRIDLRQTAPE